jgi:hypothetical protein
MTKNCWKSVDAHFQYGAGRVLLSVLPTKAAKNSIVTDYDLSEVWLPSTHDHKSLTLCWRSFWWWGREGVAIYFAYNGGQEFLCDWLPPIGGVISQDAWPKIVDALLTLILAWLYPQCAIIYLAQSIIHFVWAAFLAFSFTFFLITT